MREDLPYILNSRASPDSQCESVFVVGGAGELDSVDISPLLRMLHSYGV